MLRFAFYSERWDSPGIYSSKECNLSALNDRARLQKLPTSMQDMQPPRQRCYAYHSMLHASMLCRFGPVNGTLLASGKNCRPRRRLSDHAYDSDGGRVALISLLLIRIELMLY